jgi:hypothetical protein
LFEGVFASLAIGIRRRWRAGLTHAFSIAGLIWLVTEIVTKVSKAADDWLLQHGDIYVTGVIVAGVVWFIAYTYETRSVSFLVPTTDSRIDIRFGDLFKEPTNWLIGVNEFFDSEIGHVVSKESLHGQFIIKVYNGDLAQFRTDTDAALTGARSTQTKRQFEPSLKYEIGTTAVLRNGAQRVFLVAMAHTDLMTAKASSTVPLLWDALKGALQSVHDYGNGATLSVPLIGNGRSSVNIEPQHLLRLLVLALVDFGRKVGLPKQVNIIVPEACFEMLDIREIRRDWKKR